MIWLIYWVLWIVHWLSWEFHDLTKFCSFFCYLYSPLLIQSVHWSWFKTDIFCWRVAFSAYICYIALFVIISMIFRFLTNNQIVIMMMNCLEKFKVVIFRLFNKFKSKWTICLLRLAAAIYLPRSKRGLDNNRRITSTIYSDLAHFLV